MWQQKLFPKLQYLLVKKIPHKKKFPKLVFIPMHKISSKKISSKKMP